MTKSTREQRDAAIDDAQVIDRDVLETVTGGNDQNTDKTTDRTYFPGWGWARVPVPVQERTRTRTDRSYCTDLVSQACRDLDLPSDATKQCTATGNEKCPK